MRPDRNQVIIFASFLDESLYEYFVISVLLFEPFLFGRDAVHRTFRPDNHDGLLKAGAVSTLIGNADSPLSFFQPLGHGCL
ncbi:hypothetical protein CUC01_04970 [Akkermansia muciniphila]|nr:hypothetical protein CUB96_01785 [Akkermansia muciniphila]AYR32507.1 hypothetical protein CUC01_04970 [Akkermansia muciniphila]MCO6191097.1 hypothetical protein [Akkermansia muciniphila]MCO6193015.1 hypothetical protein [Akkermansia muciniphila]MCO6194940.1 hypothetical protein [Akkermansia muciniphila]